MWHAGKYTANIHKTLYHITAENFMRSTKEPTMRAGVMIANVIWYSAQSASGMVSQTAALVIPASMALSRPPRMPGTASREAEGVAHDVPQEGHDAGEGEALHEDGEHVLALDDAGVEGGETGNGHEQDQG